jgi:hypothetical protein
MAFGMRGTDILRQIRIFFAAEWARFWKAIPRRAREKLSEFQENAPALNLNLIATGTEVFHKISIPESKSASPVGRKNGFALNSGGFAESLSKPNFHPVTNGKKQCYAHERNRCKSYNKQPVFTINRSSAKAEHSCPRYSAQRADNRECYESHGA